MMVPFGDRRRAFPLVVMAVLAVAAFGAGRYSLAEAHPSREDGRAGSGQGSSVPAEEDLGFARDMAQHHGQAVLMSELVSQNRDPRVTQLARSISSNQLVEIGQLQGMLSLWGESWLGDDEPMSWMHSEPHGHEPHHHHHPSPQASAMPGMASQSQLDQLRRLPGPLQARTFLLLMITHHQGGVLMAQTAQERASTPVIRELARRMAYEQVEEINRMRGLLVALECSRSGAAHRSTRRSACGS